MPTARTLLRTAAAGLVAGATLAGAALAGVVADPARDPVDLLDEVVGAPATGGSEPTAATSPAGGDVATTTAAPAGLRVGAAKVSIDPRPAEFGGTWVTDPAACRTLDPGFLERLGTNPEDAAHLAHTGSPWPENPDCIYMGGFGLGPMNPVSSFDQELGLWVRSIAIGDGEDTSVLTVVDGEGWLWDYGSKCEDCGAKQLGEELGAELGIDPAGIVIAATHSHAAPDFIGGWGFVPDWYMAQVTEAIRQSVRRSVATMEPAVVEFGEAQARPFNRERRSTYRSAEEQQAGWLRAYVPGTPGKGPKQPGEPPRVIATLGAYAAHPTTRGTNDGVAHPDWPGEFERSVEERFGGVGLHFMTGLGNMSAAGSTGPGIAALLPHVGAGEQVGTPDVSAEQERWVHPVTNVPLSALGIPGFFDRRFVPGPASTSVGKSETAPCASASAMGVELAASAIRIGDRLAITTGPGELFSNLTNTIKEKSPAAVTFPLAQANDALGYMPQSFELDPIGQQGLGFVIDGYLFVNYEDSYAIDRCVGDAVLEKTLGLLGG
ncbi:MAG TPA: hypothetical protein VFV42_09295 [Acidimicrobiales bacterium]|nr:hypothetical protein [Acidimicrobiales bacterium]